MCECDDLFDPCDTPGKSLEDRSNICTRLHGDNSELIFFVHPNKEGLLGIVEDASAVGPISVQVACFKETITFFEKIVVGNELITLFFSECVKSVEFSS